MAALSRLGQRRSGTSSGQFDNPRNTRLTLLAVNAGSLYVGFDNAVDGVVVYRSASSMSR